MLREVPKRIPIELGRRAVEYVEDELSTAAHDFDGALAAELESLGFGIPFAILAPDAEPNSRDFRAAGIDDGGSDLALAVGIDTWLRRPDGGRHRLMMLEDPLARYGDPGVPEDSVHLDERVYYVADAGGGSVPDILQALKRLPGYPGIGVLSRPRQEGLELGNLTSGVLADIAVAAVAVMIRAWDDEAFLLTPVSTSSDSTFTADCLSA